MKTKINLQLVLLSVLAILLTLLLSLGVMNALADRMIHDDLKISAQILESSGAFVKEKKDSLDFSSEEIRITWIDEDGSVLYDNDVDADTMQNHLKRPEVKSALQDGDAYAVRKSDTLGQSTFYYAKKLSDGTILRVAKREDTTWMLIRGMLPFILAILVFLCAISTVLASIFTKSLIKPVEELAHNMEDYPSTTPYKELDPFVKMIRDQHMAILKGARMRQDFTANVSHELKTPLTAISGYAELMENGMIEGEEVKLYAGKICKNTERLLSLINDILRLSELDTEDRVQQMEKVDLYELAEKCVDSLKINADKNDIRLYYSGKPTLVTANKEMIYEVMYNLCDNGIRYNNKSGKVEISVGTMRERPCFKVSDNGIGIPKEHQERIFERFYRVDKSRSKQTGGTGLGLAIVKHIVALHGATLTLQSEVGAGTEITVCF